jgi:hypothetical protein
MTLIVPHNKTREAAIAHIDQGADQLFSSAAGGLVEIVDQKKEWDGSTMNFSFAGKLGLVSIPLSGTLDVDDTNVTIQCELPPVVKSFIGEEKISGGIEKQLRRLL